MSLHHFSLSIPANTSTPIEDSKLVEVGNVSQVEIYYPLNNNRYSKIWFVDGEQQVIPQNAGGYLTGSGNIQTFHLDEPVKTGRLSLRGINSDPTFEHTIDAWVNIKPFGLGDYLGF